MGYFFNNQHVAVIVDFFILAAACGHNSGPQTELDDVVTACHHQSLPSELCMTCVHMPAHAVMRLISVNIDGICSGSYEQKKKKNYRRREGSKKI